MMSKIWSFWEDLGKGDFQDPLDNRILFLDSSDFDSFLVNLKNAKIFALDVETYHLTEPHWALDPLSCCVRTLQIGLPNQVLIVDFNESEMAFQNYKRRYLQLFDTLKDKGKTNAVVLGHNLKFDLLILRRLGLSFKNCRDTMLISQIIWSGVGVQSMKVSGVERFNRCRIAHSLKGVAERLGFEVDKTEQTSDWSKELTPKQLNYAAQDVLILFSLYEKLGDLLPKFSGNSYGALAECLSLPAFVEIEYNGFPVDLDLAIDFLAAYETEYAYRENIWSAKFDIPITATKKDLVPAFKNVLGIEVPDSSDAVLGLFVAGYPEIKALLEARSLNISIQYLKNVIKKATKSRECGYGTAVHPWFRQIATGWRTGCDGKIGHSSYNPKTGKTTRKKAESNFFMNLQQISNKTFEGLPNIRQVFKAPAGYKLLIADLSQAHARIACQMSQDPTLIKAYNEGIDNHLVMATRILALENYDLSLEQVTSLFKAAKKKPKEEWSELDHKIKSSRDMAKTAFYAFLNQSGATTLHFSFQAVGIDVPVEKCQELILILRDVYGGLYEFIKKANKQANSFDLVFPFLDRTGKPLNEKYGKVVNLCGNYGYFAKTKNKFKEQYPDSIEYTESIAWQWLSSEASMIKMALAAINWQLQLSGLDAWLCGFCHDEINLIAHESCAKEVANLVGTSLKTELSKFITSIPVEESDDYSLFICSSLADK